jgi:hypothetical protein
MWFFTRRDTAMKETICAALLGVLLAPALAGAQAQAPPGLGTQEFGLSPRKKGVRGRDFANLSRPQPRVHCDTAVGCFPERHSAQTWLITREKAS